MENLIAACAQGYRDCLHRTTTANRHLTIAPFRHALRLQHPLAYSDSSFREFFFYRFKNSTTLPATYVWRNDDLLYRSSRHRSVNIYFDEFIIFGCRALSQQQSRVFTRSCSCVNLLVELGNTKLSSF